MTLKNPMFPPRETVPARYSFAAPVILDAAAVPAPTPKPAHLGRRGFLCGLVAAATLPSPAAAGAPLGRPCATDPVFAAIEAFRRTEAAFDQVTADAEASLEGGVCTNVERWDAQSRFHDEVFWPSLIDLISTPPVTLVGLAALLSFVRESGGVLDFIGDNDENLAIFDRTIECSVCAIAGLPAPALSIHLQDRDGGEHA